MGISKMKQLLIITLFMLVIVTQICTQTDDGDLDKAIGDLFNVSTDNTTDSTSKPPPKCICVPYNLCDPDSRTIVQDGSIDGNIVIDIRFGESKCDHYLDVCCDPPTTQELSTSPPIPDKPQTTTEKPELELKCGMRNDGGISFHITPFDGEAQFGEFPWMVAVLKKNWIPSSHDDLAQCGGALIHPQVILTAAHCTDKHSAEELKIRAGEWDTQTTKEVYPYQERNVKQIIRHPNFASKTLFSDIALLVLESPVKIDYHISTVCLPSQGKDFQNTDCFASGWGKDVFGKEGRYQVILKKIELPVVERQSCQKALRTTRLGPKFILHSTFICAGGVDGKDTCRGDGGSPLVCPTSNGQYEQAGIVAWGIGCGTSGVPGVYANVALFRDWIDTNMNELGFGTSTYTI